MDTRDLLVWFILIVCIVFLFMNRNLLLENFQQNINKKDKTDELNNTIGNDLENISGKKPDLIPKRIIQIWKTWTNKDPSMFAKYTESLKRTNPTYEYLFFKDYEIDIFLKNEYPDYYDTFLRLPLNIQKVDFFRYIAIYHFGGFYFDLDIMGLEPLDDLLKYDSVFPIDEHIVENACSIYRFNNFCSKGQYFLLGQYGLAAKPKNLFIKYLVDSIHNNVNNYIKHYIANSDDYVYKTTGPDFVTLAYMNYDNPDRVHILDFPHRQYFGKYAKHDYIGTWKSNN